jgi:hypothetical protein
VTGQPHALAILPPGIDPFYNIFPHYLINVSLLYNGYRVLPGGKGCRGVMLTTPRSSAEVKKELRYTSTHPMSPPGPVTGFPLPLSHKRHDFRKKIIDHEMRVIFFCIAFI